MDGILHGLAPILKWLIMKKDNELPWVMRLARWLFLVYGALFVIEKGIEVFS